MIGMQKVIGDARLVAHLGAKATAIPKAIAATTRHYGNVLNASIKARASGRPGPNAPTGDYRRSWVHDFRTVGDNAVSTNGTNKPQARRLEFGFVGPDALGRTYNQPPYPHVGPARDFVAPKWIDAIRKIQRTV